MGKMNGFPSMLAENKVDRFVQVHHLMPLGEVSVGGPNARNSKHSGADKLCGVWQDEGLAAWGGVNWVARLQSSPSNFWWTVCVEIRRTRV